MNRRVYPMCWKEYTIATGGRERRFSLEIYHIDPARLYDDEQPRRCGERGAMRTASGLIIAGIRGVSDNI